MTAQPNPDQFTPDTPENLSNTGRGWTEAKQVQFLHALAQRGNVRAACARVGLSREAAYTLRRRDEAFARGWAAAMVLANEAMGEILADRAIDGIEEDIGLRGEVVGSKRRFDTRLFLAHLARVEKAASDDRAKRDAARFDELLAVIGSGEVPFALEDYRDPVMPLDRIAAANAAASDTEKDLEAEAKAEGVFADKDAVDDAMQDAYDRALLVFDDWQTHANRLVDSLLSGAEENFPRTVSGVSSSALAAGLAQPTFRPLTDCSPRPHDSAPVRDEDAGSATGEE